MYVAAGMAALYWRLRRPMRFISRSVWWCWLPGVVVLVLGTFIDPQCPLHTESTCSIVESRVVLGVSCLTCAFYLLSAFRAFWYPGEQERRARIMLCLFFVSYAVTLLPYELTTTGVIPYQRKFYDVSVLLLQFNGLVNVLAYALNPYLARSTVVARDVLRERDSGERDFVEWAGGCNVRVVFDIWNHEQQLVPGVQRLSLRRSEEEIRRLEAARETEDESDA